MPTIDELIRDYFAQPADAQVPGEGARPPFEQNDVEYLIDGANFFGRIATDIKHLLHPDPLVDDVTETNKFFYFTNWALGLTAIDMPIPYQLNSNGTPRIFSLPQFQLAESSQPLIYQLLEMHGKHIDVRAFPWISSILMLAIGAQHAPGNFRAMNIHTLHSVATLRAVLGMQPKVIVNLLAHPAASMHLKLVILGSNKKLVAYVSGLDFVDDRRTDRDHSRNGWHDAGVRIAGPAASALYGHFRRLWNEQIAREVVSFRVPGLTQPIVSHFVGCANRDENTMPVPEHVGELPRPSASHTKYVQVLCTLPRMSFSSEHHNHQSINLKLNYALLMMHAFRQPPISFAPSGMFHFVTAMRKAIAHARQYIYMEDQGFWSLDVMRFIAQRFNDLDQAHVSLPKVIFVHGRDKDDPPNPYTEVALHLLFSSIPESARNNIAFFNRIGRTIHSKLTIIDDVWVAIGSANSMRRSLYADGEASVAIIDPAAAGNNPTAMGFAQQFRVALWREHCGQLTSTDSALVPIDKALGIWDSSWGIPPPGVRLVNSGANDRFERITTVRNVHVDETEYDLNDPDTTQVF